MDTLLGLDVSKCAVIRGGITAIVDATDLVPGDVIEVGRGQSVPADARLLTTHDLRVSEAAHTSATPVVLNTSFIRRRPSRIDRPCSR